MAEGRLALHLVAQGARGLHVQDAPALLARHVGHVEGAAAGGEPVSLAEEAELAEPHAVRVLVHPARLALVVELDGAREVVAVGLGPREAGHAAALQGAHLGVPHPARARRDGAVLEVEEQRLGVAEAAGDDAHLARGRHVHAAHRRRRAALGRGELGGHEVLQARVGVVEAAHQPRRRAAHELLLRLHRPLRLQAAVEAVRQLGAHELRGELAAVAVEDGE
mmetsp:Transcript_64479/g.172689  ORF Transcript_64479/g.172689 Transcript_64479/m.172689 type:complete len:222 (-) Transcript_64479:192-857(-)